MIAGAITATIDLPMFDSPWINMHCMRVRLGQANSRSSYCSAKRARA